jgi:hypothetical protein
LHGWSGEQALYFAFADGAFFLLRAAEALDFLKDMPTGFALIFV